MFDLCLLILLSPPLEFSVTMGLLTSGSVLSLDNCPVPVCFLGGALSLGMDTSLKISCWLILPVPHLLVGLSLSLSFTAAQHLPPILPFLFSPGPLSAMGCLLRMSAVIRAFASAPCQSFHNHPLGFSVEFRQVLFYRYSQDQGMIACD